MLSKPIIKNVIGVGHLLNSTKLNLQKIAEKVEGSRLNSKKFPGLVIRKTKPKGTVLLFSTNRFIIVGAESQEDCEIISRRIAKDVQKVLSMPHLKLKSFKISNLIASANLGYPVNIARIAELPNAFKDDKSSGVFVKTPKVKCVVVFQTGKMLFNGATKREDIDETFEVLLIEFEQYKLKNFNNKIEPEPNKLPKNPKKKCVKSKNFKDKDEVEKNVQVYKSRQEKLDCHQSILREVDPNLEEMRQGNEISQTINQKELEPKIRYSGRRRQNYVNYSQNDSTSKQ